MNFFNNERGMSVISELLEQIKYLLTLKWQPETAMTQIKLRGHVIVWYVWFIVCNITS